MSIVPLAEARDFLNFEGTDDDAELQDVINRAEAILAKRVGPLAPVTVTNEVHTGPGPIVLRKYPVVSVSSATNSGVPVYDLDADFEAGVAYGTFSSQRRAVKISYVAGRSVLDEDLVAAVLELVKHLWDSQRGNAPAAMALQGADPTDFQPAGGSYLLPYRVQTLIEPHLLPASIA